MTQKKDNEKVTEANVAEAVKIATQGAALLAMAGPKAAGAYIAYEGASTLTGRSIGPFIKRRFDDAVQRVYQMLGRDPHTEEAANAPEAELDAFALVFRSLLESPDEDVVPAIEALAASYIAQGRKADTFMRRTARMLVDLNAEDLRCVYETLLQAKRHAEEGPVLAIVATWDKEDTVIVRPYRTGHSGKHTYGVQNGKRAVEILAGSQIGRHHDVHGGVALLLDNQTIERLVEILSHAPAAMTPAEPPAP